MVPLKRLNTESRISPEFISSAALQTWHPKFTSIPVAVIYIVVEKNEYSSSVRISSDKIAVVSHEPVNGP